jgi:hypothetical protein
MLEQSIARILHDVYASHNNVQTSMYEISRRQPMLFEPGSAWDMASVLRAQCALVRTSYKPMPQELLLNQQHASIYDDDLTGRVPTSHKA